MGFSKQAEAELMTKYREKFGTLPDHIGRWVANTGQRTQMFLEIQDSLETGKPSTWNKYIY